MTLNIEKLKERPVDYSHLNLEQLQKTLQNLETSLINYNEANKTYLNTSVSIEVVKKEILKKLLTLTPGLKVLLDYKRKYTGKDLETVSLAFKKFIKTYKVLNLSVLTQILNELETAGADQTSSHLFEAHKDALQFCINQKNNQ